MQTTLTLDDDVAAELERVRLARDAKLKDLVNEALRLGLRELETAPAAKAPFRTRSFDGGKPLLDNVDNVAEVLAQIEGEDFR